MEYVGLSSTLLTSVYVEQTRLIAEAEGDRRTELLSILLEGYDESDAKAAKLLRRAGYLQQRQAYCVIVAHSVKPEEMENTARAQRMLDAIAKELSQSPIRYPRGYPRQPGRLRAVGRAPTLGLDAAARRAGGTRHA